MKKHSTIILTLLFWIFSLINCYCQDQKKLKINLEGGYQLWKDQVYLVGFGAKMEKTLNGKVFDNYQIHFSAFYERFIQPDFLKDHYGLTSRLTYEFKYFTAGLSARHLNLFQTGKYRIDITPEIGVGYKYIWFTYSRNLLIYQDKAIAISKDAFRFMINIPLFDIII